jgi:hypothetical protein
MVLRWYYGAGYVVRLCTELTPVFFDVVVMAVFPKMNRPRNKHNGAYTLRGWSVVWLGNQTVRAPSPRSEGCYMSWLTIFLVVVWMAVANSKSILCVAGWVPFGAFFVLWRGRPGSCVAVGSKPPTPVLNGVAMVVCWLRVVQGCAQN